MLRAPLAALVVVVGALALVGSARADPRFDPGFDVTLTQPAPQVPSELTVKFRLESGYQLSTTVVYLPLDWGVARGEEIPVGTKVGAVDSIETYGFINSACNNPLAITFELFNATVDPSRTVSFNDMEMELGLDPSTPGFGIQDFAEDKDGNGLLDAIDQYPHFLSTAFGEMPPITRMAGIAYVAGVPVLLQFLIFPPSTRLDLPDALLSHSIAGFAKSGYPALMVVQDFRSPDNAHQPWPITDYCTPRDMSITFSPPEDGPPVLINPQAGPYGFTLLALSKRDADGDGYQNSLDTCPLDGNAGSPAILASGDADKDGLDAACDPNDNSAEDWIEPTDYSDLDRDGYLNRQDNCPLVFNHLPDIGYLKGEQTDEDFDDIGDACDPSPESPDGDAIVSVKSVEVIVGEASGSGGPPKAAACPHCYQLGDARGEAEAEGEGGQLAVAIGLIGVGAGATAIVVGSGTLYLLRRRRS